MSITTAVYTGVVGQQTFAVPFAVPNTTDLMVTVNAVTAPFTIVDSKIVLTTPVATDGHLVVISTEFGAINFPATSTNLAANATFTGKERDAWSIQSPGEASSYFNVTAFSSHASAPAGFRIESREAGGSWVIEAQSEVSAGVPVTLSVPITTRFYRSVLVNGATATTALRINSSFTKA